MQKILYSTVMYPNKDFEIFINDYLSSVFNQTYKNFELLVVLDDVDIVLVQRYIDKINKDKIKIHIRKYDEKFTPIELRKKLIDISYELNADILIFSDFDENVAGNRIEEVVNKINNYDFAFNDFFIVDKNLNRLISKSFFETRDIPLVVENWTDIKSYNYIGFGSLAINLKSFDYKNFEFPKEIKALDWFLATYVLLHSGKGIKLDKTYANYRQHESSFVGFNFKLDTVKLKQGLDVVLNHYKYFKEYNNEFNNLYNETRELQNFIEEISKEKYIDIINNKFDSSKFCWWENIKTKKELL